MTATGPDRLHVLLLRLIRDAGLLQPDESRSGPDALSLSEGFALSEIADAGVLSQQALGGRLHLEKSTVSRLVGTLEKRGLVVRERDPADLRLWLLRLTAAGRGAARCTTGQYHQAHQLVLGGMSAAECAALEVGLTALLRELRTHGEARTRGSGG